jgi:hypothetical protein
MEPAADPLHGIANYRTNCIIGNGAFGSVVLAERTRDGAQVAIKLLKRASVNRFVQQEIENHCLLWHPHVGWRGSCSRLCGSHP